MSEGPKTGYEVTDDYDNRRDRKEDLEVDVEVAEEVGTYSLKTEDN